MTPQKPLPIKPMGPIPHDHVYDVLRKADALVMGSQWPENAPMVIGEARAVGCPIIAPKIGGIPEIVEDGVDGILYNTNDKEALIKAFIKIASGTKFHVRPQPTKEEQYTKIEMIYEELCK